MRRIWIALFIVAALVASATALTPEQGLLLNSRPGWVLPGAAADLNFASGQYFGLSPAQLTVSRASVEYEVCNGQLYNFAANQAPITPGCGWWEWPQRTNSVPNSTMQGAAVGVLPTGWGTSVTGAVTPTVTAVVSDSGMTTVQVQMSGTPNASGVTYLVMSPALTIAAAYGQTWTGTAAIKLVSGSLTNLIIYSPIIRATTSGGGFTESSAFTPITPTGAGIGTQVYSASYALVQPTTAYVALWLPMTVTNGQPINATFEIAIPQAELNSNLSALVASAVKVADGAGGANGSGVYTVAGGTCATQPTLNVTWAAGVLTVNSVANAGSCSVLPPSPATLAYASGAATGWTGATATLTPTDNSAQGFATGPILTAGSAATRAQSNISLPLSVISMPSGAALVSAQLFSGQSVLLLDASDGTSNNRVGINRNSAVQANTLYVRAGATAQPFSNVGASSALVSIKAAASWNGSSVVTAYGGTAPVSLAIGGAISGLSEVKLGSSGTNLGNAACNCLITRAAFWHQAVSASALQQATK